MSPFISIWASPRLTIDRIKDSNWVNGPGLLVYLVLGINDISEADVPAFILNIQNVFMQNLSLLALGIVWGFLYRLIWVNLMFFIGKSLEGQATKRNIDTVLALSSTPEFLKFFYLAISLLVGGESLINFAPSYVVEIVCSISSFVIAIICLHHVQKFAYKYVILNIIMPLVVLIALAYLIF
ncbi:MAG TPA: YIP1 family protein [Cyclobacteriaceae bacterium]